MILYLDTSALVKLYVAEPESDRVHEAIAAAELIATSVLSYVETQSAFARKQRLAQLDAPDLWRLKREFEHEWTSGFYRLAVDEMLVRRAGELCGQHSLRAYDAVHLATADILQGLLGVSIIFACFDNALNRAARSRGFGTLVTA